MNARLFLFAALLLGMAIGTDAAPKEPRLQSLWVQNHEIRRDVERGSLLGDFHWAAQAKTLSAAIERWTAFLRQHTPKKGDEGEDATQDRLLKHARLELARACYLAGRVKDGDELLRRVVAKP